MLVRNLLLLLLLLLLKFRCKSNSNPIMYLPTQEGITSQIVQLERLWSKADIVNRSVTIRNFESYHFPDVSRVNICNLFNFPSTIKCTNASLIDIVHKHNCHLIQNHSSWSSNPLSYMLPKNVVRDPYFEVSKVDCIAGFIHESEGVIPLGTPNFRKFDNLSISAYYYKMLPDVRKVLNISTQDFVAMHWRRGDQLESRCREDRNKKRFGTRDMSINCHSVKDFINVTKSLLIKENIKNSSVVVATNEQSKEQLLELHSAGYQTVSLLKNNKQYQHFNSVDFFMIDLVLMYEAKWLFQWGISEVHDLVNGYLRRKIYPEKFTYIDIMN